MPVLPEAVWSFVQKEIAMKDSIPPAFFHGATWAMALCVIVCSLSFIVSPKLWPSTFEEKKHLLFHTTLMALVPGICVPILMYPEVLNILKWMETHSEERIFEVFTATQGIWTACGFCCGYMVIDTLTYAIWPKQMMTALGKPLFIQYVLHHIFSLVVWPYALGAGMCVLPIAYFLATEASGPFVNGRWLADAMGNKKLFMIMGVSMIVVFFVVRIVPMPYLFYYLLQVTYQYNNYTWTQVGIALFTVPIPFMLNLFWFKLMIKAAAKMLMGGGKKKTQ